MTAMLSNYHRYLLTIFSNKISIFITDKNNKKSKQIILNVYSKDLTWSKIISINFESLDLNIKYVNKRIVSDPDILFCTTLVRFSNRSL